MAKNSEGSESSEQAVKTKKEEIRRQNYIILPVKNIIYNIL